MKNFLIFALLITYVHSPTYSFLKIKLSEGADFPVMGISHKHAPKGSPFVMEFVVNSKNYPPQTIFIDNEDSHIYTAYKWWVKATKNNKKEITSYYVHAWINGRHETLHRVVMGLPDSFVDHIDGNPLNCSRSNLRLATIGQNKMNSKVYETNTSGFKGVHAVYRKRKDGSKLLRYVARISLGNKRFFLGVFKNPEEAAKKYNEAAPFYHGEFARLNVL